MLAALLFPTAATAQNLDSVTRSQRLEPSDFPREVVLIGEPPMGLSQSDWESAARRATQTWNDVSCSSAELRFSGSSSSDARPEASTAIVFVDPAEDPCFVNAGDLGWTLLAACGDWRPTDVLLNGANFTWRTEPQPYQDSTSAVDAVSVITHELGHSLGLHHSDVDSDLATMAPRYLRDGGLATLSAQDKLALCALYPVNVSECAQDDDCAGGCVEGEFGSVCDEYRAPLGAYCDLAELECSTCLVTSSATFSGYCSAACDDNADCDDLVCEEGFCRYPFVERETTDCNSVHGMMSWVWLWIPLFVRRRYSKASV